MKASEVTILGLAACDACRAARAALPGARFRDVRALPLAPDEIARLLDALGPGLVNRRSTTWRGLSEAERARDPLDLLSDHPTLMKRPVIVAGDAAYLGWSKSVQAALAP